MTDTNLEKAREMEDPPSCEWCGAMAGCPYSRCPAMAVEKARTEGKVEGLRMALNVVEVYDGVEAMKKRIRTLADEMENKP